MTIRICVFVLFATAFACAEDNPAFDNPDSIFFQARKGNLEKVKTILNSDPKLLNQLDYLERTPLFYAAKSGRADVVDWLLEQKGIRTDLLDSYGKSALHWPSMYGHLRVLETMGKHKLDFNIRSKDGETPLHVAPGNIFSNAHGRHAEVVKILLQFGADPNLTDKDKRTPLFAAFSLVGRKDSIKALLSDPRTEINARDRKGETVLHHAVRTGSVDGVKLLLENDADASIRNLKGEIPADLLHTLNALRSKSGKEMKIREIRERLEQTASSKPSPAEGL